MPLLPALPLLPGLAPGPLSIDPLYPPYQHTAAYRAYLLSPPRAHTAVTALTALTKNIENLLSKALFRSILLPAWSTPPPADPW